MGTEENRSESRRNREFPEQKLKEKLTLYCNLVIIFSLTILFLNLTRSISTRHRADGESP